MTPTGGIDVDQHRCWVEIDLDAIFDNVARLVAALVPPAQLMAVVKADGYGHGAVQVARTAAAAGATWLGTATLDEALSLVAAGVHLPVLVLGWTPPARYGEAVAGGIRLTVSSQDEATALARAAAGELARVHIKVDTGMGRLGLRPGEELEAAVAVMSRLDNLRVEGMFTHFACADQQGKSPSQEQLQRFLGAAAVAESELGSLIKHAANTAGLLQLPESHLDLVRAGIGVYGLYPSAEVSRAVKLRPAMTWKARVAMVKTVTEGCPISYGYTYRTSCPASILTLAVGYADGYFRALGGRAHVLVSGRRLPVVGRVCMDQCMVEATGDVAPRPGSSVVLMGGDAGEEIAAEEIASLVGTINYEVVTTIGVRVPRIHVGGRYG